MFLSGRAGYTHDCQQSPESASIWTGRRPQNVGGQGWVSSDKCPVWTGVRGAAVQAESPAKPGRSEATRLDGGEHTPKLSVGRCPGHHNILGSAPARIDRFHAFGNNDSTHARSPPTAGGPLSPAVGVRAGQVTPEQRWRACESDTSSARNRCAGRRTDPRPSGRGPRGEGRQARAAGAVDRRRGGSAAEPLAARGGTRVSRGSGGPSPSWVCRRLEANDGISSALGTLSVRSEFLGGPIF